RRHGVGAASGAGATPSRRRSLARWWRPLAGRRLGRLRPGLRARLRLGLRPVLLRRPLLLRPARLWAGLRLDPSALSLSRPLARPPRLALLVSAEIKKARRPAGLLFCQLLPKLSATRARRRSGRRSPPPPPSPARPDVYGPCSPDGPRNFGSRSRRSARPAPACP